MKYRLAAILISLVFNSIAQVNLVPNPSFEDYSQCPDFNGQITFANLWRSPSTGSPDYFNNCSTNTDFSTPNNLFGSQQPYQDNGYVGIGTFFASSSYPFREYIQSKLLLPLQSNKNYCVEMHVSLAGGKSQYATNKLGMHFSVDTISNYSPLGPILNFIPQIYWDSTVSDTAGWVKLTGLYHASGAENYITIGNFNTNAQTNAVPLNNNGQEISYYYIDNVSVVECDTTLSPIAPNTFTPNNDGINDVFQIEFLPANSQLAIYNRWGSLIYSSDNYQNNWDGQNHSPGVYYYILTLPGGNTKKATITLLRD